MIRRRSGDAVRGRIAALYFRRDAHRAYAGTMAINGRILIVEDDTAVVSAISASRMTRSGRRLPACVLTTTRARA